MIAIIIALVFILLFLLFISWQVHKDMVISSCDTYTHGTIKEFYIQFYKYDWSRSEDFSHSLFGVSSPKTEVHASIISFEGKGIILDPISFLILGYKLRFNKMPPLKRENRVAYLRDKYLDKLL